MAKQTDKAMSDEQNDLERVESFLGSYGYLVSKALVDLASAVETALNNGDRAVIREMKEVSEQIFQQAEEALLSSLSNVQ